MRDIVIKFPASKRKLSEKEEKQLRICVNKINAIYAHPNPFISDEQKNEEVDHLLRTLIKKVFELNEE